MRHTLSLFISARAALDGVLSSEFPPSKYNKPLTNTPHLLISYSELTNMSDTSSRSTESSPHAEEAEIAWDTYNEEDDRDVTKLNEDVLSRLPQAGSDNQILARRLLTQMESERDIIRGLIVKAKGARTGHIETYVLLFQ